MGKLPVDTVSQLLESTGVDLLLTRLPGSSLSGVQQAEDLTKLYSNHSNLAWSLTDHSSVLPTRLYHMLLFTLPGTPVFNRGDEVGLKDTVSIDQWIEKKLIWTNFTALTYMNKNITLLSFSVKSLLDLA